MTTNNRIRIIFVGGFLGAGKTTLLARTAGSLLKAGKRVGLLTNDQAADLVDTGLLALQGFEVNEVSGGCFCCRFGDLVQAADRLLERLQPDVLLGEPVGSCTDISATVLQPMKDLYGDRFVLAPFSVLADPARIEQALAPAGTDAAFPDNVLYIFRKQLEEADAIVLNKIDLLDQSQRDRLRDLVRQHFPDIPVFLVSARTGAGVDEWLAYVMEEDRAGQRVTDVDYDVYAEGEAALGWLNALVELRTEDAAPDWTALCTRLLECVRHRCADRRAEIAHVKLLLQTSDGAVTGNVTGSTMPPTVENRLTGAPSQAMLTFNARVHMAPETLEKIVRHCLHDVFESLSLEIRDIRSFRPGRPRPVHRYDAPVDRS